MTSSSSHSEYLLFLQKRKVAGKRAAAKAAAQADELPSKPSRPHKSAVPAEQEIQDADAVMCEATDRQADTVGEETDLDEPVDPRAARRKSRAAQQHSLATATADTAGEAAAVEAEPVADEANISKAAPASRHAAAQRPQNSRASSQTQATSEAIPSATGSEQLEASEQGAQVRECVTLLSCTPQLPFTCWKITRDCILQVFHPAPSYRDDHTAP